MTHVDRLELVLLAAIWGASFLFMRVATPEFGAFALVEIRVAIGALFLIAVLLWRGGGAELLRLAAPLTVVGIFGSAVPFVLFAYATLKITAGTAAVVNATAPLFAAVVGYLWLRDKLRPTQSLGLAIGFGGVLLLLWDRIALNVEGAAWAISACLVATLCYGVAVNYTKKNLTGVAPIVNAAGSQLAAAVLLLPLAMIYWPADQPSVRSWYSVTALGVLCTGVAFILYFRLIARIGPARAITTTYLIPVFGMLWGLVFLYEPISAGMIAACGIIIVGIALATGGLRSTLASRE
ncbi:MAG: DMT family transporter [Gammaproteobacteria bacterium]|nr:DMT family transporter [Gammaproteobacteria bacterium]MDH5214276.1 DMT family transporter [Gammaproteobacteria bacterium]